MDISMPQHLTLSDKILEVIENAIMSGSIKPGQRIIETEMAKKLGTSKSPVREALKRLEGDGIVEFVPRKGYTVKVIDRKSIDAFFDIFFILEPEMAKMALKKMNDAAYKVLDEFIEGMERFLDENDYEAYLTLNDQFHSYFYTLTENEWAIKISRMFHKHSKMMRSLSLHKRNRVFSSKTEHREIVASFKQKDERLVEEAVKNHLRKFKENILKADELNQDS